MSASVLIKGNLFRQAEQRTASKTGNRFVTATVKVRDGDAADWWKVLAFSEIAQTELLRLSDGDALAVQGSLKVEPYERNGETRINLTCIVDQVLALRQPPKQRKKANADQPRQDQAPPPDFADDVPF